MRGLHDAELLGLKINKRDDTVELYFFLVNDTHCTIVLGGVKSFRSQDIIVQNVLSRLLTTAYRQLSHAEIGKWIEWSTSLSDANTFLSRQQQDEWIKSCENGTLTLVVIEPSAGAEIASVCEEISIEYERESNNTK